MLYDVKNETCGRVRFPGVVSEFDSGIVEYDPADAIWSEKAIPFSCVRERKGPTIVPWDPAVGE